MNIVKLNTNDKNERIYKVEIKGKVNLKILDKNGNVVKEINKENTDTVVSKFNVPTSSTLYADIILKSFDSIIGQPFNKISKTIFEYVDKVRSGEISPSFSYDSNNKKYECIINYTNDTTEGKQVYGLCSFTNFNSQNVLMTILDLTDENIIIEQSQQLIGKYIIEYNEATSSDNVKDVNVVEYDKNRVLRDVYINKYLREYKYTRAFVQTGEWLGVDTNDIPQSSINVTISNSNDNTKKTFGDDSQYLAEYYIKFTSDGSPGTATGKKYLMLYSGQYNLNDYRSTAYGGTWTSAFRFIHSGNNDIDYVISNNSYSFEYGNYYIKCNNIKIYSIKYIYPTIDKTFDTELIRFAFYNTKYFYVYWQDDNRLKVFAGDANTKNVAINGVYFIDDTNTQTQLNTDSDGYYLLPSNSGNGIIYIDTSAPRTLLFHNNMYSYTCTVPVNAISNGDVTELMCGTNGNWGNLTDFNDEYYTNVFVKEVDKDLSLGIINGQKYMFRYSDGGFNNFMFPYYYKYNDGYMLINYFYKYIKARYYYDGYRTIFCYFLYTFIPFSIFNFLFKNDFDNKIINLNKFNTDSELVHNFSISYRSSYNDIVSLNINTSSYLKYLLIKYRYDGNNLIVNIDNLPEETIQQTETIGDTTIQFSSDSVFKSGEYFKFPINDNDNCLIIDKLEIWESTEVTNKYYDNEFWEKYNSTSSIWVSENSNNYEDIYLFQPKKIKLKKPNFGIHDCSNKYKPNKYAIYEIPISVDSNYYPCLLLPKKIQDGSNLLFVNTDSIYVTNGMHVIPYEVSMYLENIETDNDIDLSDEYWKIKVDYETLKDVYGDNAVSNKVQLYVFFEAKEKTDYLPYEVEFVINKDNENLDYATYKIELPFDIDSYIKVLDEENNELQFELRKLSGKELQSDTDTGNILYIKVDISDVEARDIFKFNFNYMFANSGGTNGLNIYNMTMYVDDYIKENHIFDKYARSEHGIYCGHCYHYVYLGKSFSNIFHSYIKKYNNYIKYNISKHYVYKRIKILSDTNNNNTNILYYDNVRLAINEQQTKYKFNCQFSTSLNLSDCVEFYSNEYNVITKLYYSRHYEYGYTLIPYANQTLFNNVKIEKLDNLLDTYFYNLSGGRIFYKTTLIRKLFDFYRNYLMYSRRTVYNNSQKLMYFNYIYLDNVNNNIRVIQRTKYNIPHKNLPISYIKIDNSINNVRILTKKYKYETDFDIYPNNITDIEFPFSKDNENYALFLPDYISKSNIVDRFVVHSVKLYHIINNNYGTNSWIGCITENDYNNIDCFDTSLSVTYNSTLTPYFVFSYNSITADNEQIKSNNILRDSSHNYLDLFLPYSFYNYLSTNKYKLNSKFIKNTSVMLQSGTETKNFIKIEQADILKNSSQNYLTLLLAKEEIAIDKIDDFGKFTFDIYTNEVNNGFEIYPVIIIKDTINNSEYLFGIDKYQKPIKLDYLYNKLIVNNEEIDNHILLSYLLKDRLTYEDFNQLFSTYKDGNGTYNVKYGLLIWSNNNVYYKFNGITISPVFNDDSFYDEIPYAYFNSKTGLLSDDKNLLIPDTTNKKIKIHLPEYRLILNIIDATTTTIKVRKYDYSLYERGLIEGLNSVIIDDKYTKSVASVTQTNESGVDYYIITLSETLSDIPRGVVVNASQQNNNVQTQVVYINLEKTSIDVNSFTNGVVCKDNLNNNIPTCYEDIYNKPNSDFSLWNKKGLFVKVNIKPLESIELTLSDEINAFYIDDVFDFCETFEESNSIKNNFDFSYIPINLRDNNAYNIIDFKYTHGSNNKQTFDDITLDNNSYTSRLIFVKANIEKYGSERTILLKGDYEPIIYDKIKNKIILHSKNEQVYIENKNMISNLLEKGITIRYKQKTNKSDCDFRIELIKDTNVYMISRGNVRKIQRYINGTSINEVSSKIYFNICDNYLIEEFSWKNKLRLDNTIFSKFQYFIKTPNHIINYFTHYNEYYDNEAKFKLWLHSPNNKIYIDYIYITNQYPRKAEVLYEEDLSIAIPENIQATWYIIDTVTTSSSSKTTIENYIVNYDKYINFYEYCDNDEYDLWYYQFRDGYYDVKDLGGIICTTFYRKG